MKKLIVLALITLSSCAAPSRMTRCKPEGPKQSGLVTYFLMVGGVALGFFLIPNK